MLAGGAALWIWGILPRHPRAGLALGLSAAGWTLLLVGLFILMGVLTHIAFLITWVLAAAILGSLVNQYRSSVRYSLLWSLRVAAERGIPLEAAARAFAEERRDVLGRRALDLADYLEAGLPLALALRRAGLFFPPEVMLAADLGQQTSQLGVALRQVLDRDEGTEELTRALTEKLFYLVGVVTFGLGVWVFVLLKIVPAYERILQDFALRMPAVTQVLLTVSRFVAMYWFLLFPLAAILVVLLVAGLGGYVRAAPRVLPRLGLLVRPADGAVVLRWLATAVRQERPLAEMIRVLAGYFPQWDLRRRLKWSAKRIEQGADWCDSLRRNGVLHRPECAVFQAAARAGNLAWALEAMADNRVRRAVYRLRALLSLGFPLAVAVIGGVVLFFAVALLIPLFALIQGLA
jgi:type II secretory pathway component PulF